MARMFLSIKWKFLMVGIVLVFLPTFILGLVIYRTYRQEAADTIRRDLRLIAAGWYTAADIYYQEVQRILKREEYLVEKRLGSIALDVKKMVALEAAAHSSASEARLLDQVSRIKVGRSGYVFIIDGQDRFVLSGGRKDDGQKVADTSPGAKTAEYLAIISSARQLKEDESRTFHFDWSEPGSVDLRKKMSVLVYVPERNWVIGVGTYYSDFKSYDMERIVQDELKTRMASQKIGERGYVWVLNTAGSYVVSKDRFRDGENVMAARDARGRLFVLDIIQLARGLGAEGYFAYEYPWKNIGEQQPLNKMAAVMYYPKWDWIIGASAYETDYLKGLATIKWRVFQICALFMVLGSLVAYVFALWISRPIRKLEGVAASGNLNAIIDRKILDSNDEIGSLAQAFLSMMRHLNDKINEIEKSRMALIKSNSDLESAHGRLAQSEKLAAIGQLAAGVAHEVNNPLAYVMSNLGTLEQYVKTYEEVLDGYDSLCNQEPGAERQTGSCLRSGAALKLREQLRLDEVRRDMADLLVELNDGLERVKRIVIDLRAFARSESDVKVAANVRDIIEKVITIAGNEIRSKAHLEKDYGDLPPINCFPYRLGQVFMNIIVNAAQAVPPGEGVIRIRTFVEGASVVVEVTDNGCGILPENRDRIFEPFFTTKPVGQGTGLGLSVSYEIIKSHHGEIAVASEPGKGSIITIRLPIKAG
ncbi:MAG: cache domain-containing protein [Candidatus Omnitrophica bacterium]|nr:cache domain-containing protein [Candidatus Omnitrophota bacterium]